LVYPYLSRTISYIAATERGASWGLLVGGKLPPAGRYPTAVMRNLVPLTLAPSLPVALIPKPADVPTVLQAAADKARNGVRGAMVTVLSRKGSAPSTPGQKLYAASDGTCVGTVGGGAIEREAITALEQMISGESEDHRILTCSLGPQLGMCCGGSVELLIEPLAGFIPCLLVGGGHVASAVAPLLAKVGFVVTVVDARESWGQEGRIEGARCVVGDYDDVGNEIPTSGVVLVMTHDHALDQKVIEWALRRGFAFVGGVGSRAKAERTRARLEAKGFPEADRARVRMPLGASIGARLPDEIAVAIAAEMVTWRRSK
jgi:xanthine dehydrogenase accessory factor